MHYIVLVQTNAIRKGLTQNRFCKDTSFATNLYELEQKLFRTQYTNIW